VVVAVSYSDRVQRPDGQRSWTRYAALGDSFTEGLCDDVGPDERHRGWADLVALALADRASAMGATGAAGEIEYANLAVRGRLIRQVVSEQVPAAIELGPDLTSLAVGVNDTLRRTFDVDAAATDLENGVRALRQSGSDVLIFAFGNPARRSRVMGLIRERIRAYNTAVEAIAQRYHCFVVRYWDVAAMDDDRLWADDRLHLSPSGHALAAASALEALGIGDSQWRTPLVPMGRPALPSTAAGHTRWVTGHLAPWMARRARGSSSGDGVAPKHAQWVRVRPGEFVVPTDFVAPRD
jgi:lysophospholipase L1-like esterase